MEKPKKKKSKAALIPRPGAVYFSNAQDPAQWGLVSFQTVEEARREEFLRWAGQYTGYRGAEASLTLEELRRLKDGFTR